MSDINFLTKLEGEDKIKKLSFIDTQRLFAIIDQNNPLATNITGATGSIGMTGLIGDIGPIGASGLRGSDGITGDIGPMGFQGFTGFDGDSIIGPTGSQGLDGAPGNAGAPGDPSDPGPQGPPGSQGPQGAQGIGAETWLDLTDTSPTGYSPAETFGNVQSFANYSMTIVGTTTPRIEHRHSTDYYSGAPNPPGSGFAQIFSSVNTTSPSLRARSEIIACKDVETPASLQTRDDQPTIISSQNCYGHMERHSMMMGCYSCKNILIGSGRFRMLSSANVSNNKIGGFIVASSGNCSGINIASKNNDAAEAISSENTDGALPVGTNATGRPGGKMAISSDNSDFKVQILEPYQVGNFNQLSGLNMIIGSSSCYTASDCATIIGSYKSFCGDIKTDNQVLGTIIASKECNTITDHSTCISSQSCTSSRGSIIGSNDCSTGNIIASSSSQGDTVNPNLTDIKMIIASSFCYDGTIISSYNCDSSSVGNGLTISSDSCQNEAQSIRPLPDGSPFISGAVISSSFNCKLNNTTASRPGPDYCSIISSSDCNMNFSSEASDYNTIIASQNSDIISGPIDNSAILASYNCNLSRVSTNRSLCSMIASNSAPGAAGTTAACSMGTSLNNTFGNSLRVTNMRAGTCIVAPSDERLKKDIVLSSPYPDLLSKVLGTNIYRFHFNEESDLDEYHLGFVAQEIQKDFPEIVNDKDYNQIWVNKKDGIWYNSNDQTKIENKDIPKITEHIIDNQGGIGHSYLDVTDVDTLTINGQWLDALLWETFNEIIEINNDLEQKSIDLFQLLKT